jgi:hypothetical protein
VFASVYRPDRRTPGGFVRLQSIGAHLRQQAARRSLRLPRLRASCGRARPSSGRAQNLENLTSGYQRASGIWSSQGDREMNLLWDQEPLVAAGECAQERRILRRNCGQVVLTYSSRLRAPCLVLLVCGAPALIPGGWPGTWSGHGQNVLTYFSRLRAFRLAFPARGHPAAEAPDRRMAGDFVRPRTERAHLLQ